VAGPLASVTTQAPVAREGLDILETRGASADRVLERMSGPSVQLRPTSEQQALIDNFLEEKARESIVGIGPLVRGAIPPGVHDLLQEVLLLKALQHAIKRRPLTGARPEEGGTEHRAQDGRLLEGAPGPLRQTVYTSEQEPVDRGG